MNCEVVRSSALVLLYGSGRSNCGNLSPAAAGQGNKENNYVIREQIMGITAVATNQGRTKWITVDIQLQDINYIG